MLEAVEEEPEPLSSDAGLDLRAAGELLAELGHAIELAVHVVGLENLAACVDGNAIVRRSVATDRVVVLEAETDGVHQRVASAASRIDFVLFEFLARGNAGHRVGRLGDVRRWGGQLLAKQLLAHELPAVNG